MPRTEHVADIVRTTSLVDVDYEPVFLDMRISETEFAKDLRRYFKMSRDINFVFFPVHVIQELNQIDVSAFF